MSKSSVGANSMADWLGAPSGRAAWIGRLWQERRDSSTLAA